MLSALGISEISVAAASTGASTGRAKQPAVRATVVVHGEAMVAEGIAAALSRYPGLAVVGVATSLLEVERWEGRADAVVLDPGLPRAREAIARLRSKGIRVVLVGEDDGDGGSNWAPADDQRQDRGTAQASCLHQVGGFQPGCCDQDYCKLRSWAMGGSNVRPASRGVICGRPTPGLRRAGYPE